MSSAGILFIESTQFLSGFQRKLNRWSGFGGKALPNESPQETAVRETVEEIFEVNLTRVHIDELERILYLGNYYESGSYIFYTLPFSALLVISAYLATKKYISPVYHSLPTNINDIVEKRISEKATEIEKVCFFSFYDLPELQDAFDKNLRNDLSFFIG
jgi:8-oxo-dGTP pyrophosphatase MutT (NUDIX family)